MKSSLINIQVYSRYIAEQSAPQQSIYVFSYTIKIKNIMRHQIQLLRRYWLITHANGKQIAVKGEGVIGQQPIILASSEFQYNSGVILATPCGTMEGHYEMLDHQKQLFTVQIPVFRLATPHLIN